MAASQAQMIAFQAILLCLGFVQPAMDSLNVNGINTTQDLIVGKPSSLHPDDAPELMQGKFKEICKDYQIPCTYAEPYSPWQNRVELGIKELKRQV